MGVDICVGVLDNQNVRVISPQTLLRSSILIFPVDYTQLVLLQYYFKVVLQRKSQNPKGIVFYSMAPHRKSTRTNILLCEDVRSTTATKVLENE
jgi:hypothetical protein